MNVNTQGRIIAVVTTTDSIHTANIDVILAAGPWIMQILEALSIQQPPIERAPVATGIYAFPLALTSEQWEKYNNLPWLSDIGVGMLIK